MRIGITGTLITIFLLLAARNLMAQDSLDILDTGVPAPHALFLEIGGRGGIYSINYEYLFDRESGFSMGVMMYNENMFSDDYRRGGTSTTAIPFSFSYALWQGSGRMYCDFGLTAASVKGRSDDWLLLIPSAGLGYQYRPYESSFLFKGQVLVGFYGMVAIPWAGISVGHSF